MEPNVQEFSETKPQTKQGLSKSAILGRVLIVFAVWYTISLFFTLGLDIFKYDNWMYLPPQLFILVVGISLARSKKYKNDPDYDMKNINNENNVNIVPGVIKMISWILYLCGVIGAFFWLAFLFEFDSLYPRFPNTPVLNSILIFFMSYAAISAMLIKAGDSIGKLEKESFYYLLGVIISSLVFSFLSTGLPDSFYFIPILSLVVFIYLWTKRKIFY